MQNAQLIIGKQKYDCATELEAQFLRDEAYRLNYPEAFDIEVNGQPRRGYVPWLGARRYIIPARRIVAKAANGKVSKIPDLWPQAGQYIEASILFARDHGKSYGGRAYSHRGGVRSIQWVVLRNPDKRSCTLIVQETQSAFS